MSKQSFSGLSLIWRGLNRHRGWQNQWRKAAPKPRYDAVIVGGGGHGLGTAYYLAQEHGLTNIAVLGLSKPRNSSPASHITTFSFLGIIIRIRTRGRDI